MRLRGFLKTTAIGAGALMAAALLSGATYERIMRHRTTSRIDMPGRLIDVGHGRRVHLDCRGAGSPTVVLESGLDAFGSLAWSFVQDSIARTTRVCAYSRPGIMWSDGVRGAFDGRSVARDLHTALTSAGESAPWVMVGHSLGGPLITVFTSVYAAEVVGLVYVDPTHPDQFARWQEITGKSLLPAADLLRVGAALAWTGIVRLMPQPPSPAWWPRAIDDMTKPFLSLGVDELRREVEGVPSILKKVGTLRSFGDRPVIVLTASIGASAEDVRAMGLDAEQGAQLRLVARQLHAEMATWSRAGHHEVVEGASHYIQFDRPDAVIRAVERVIRSASGANQSVRRG